MKEPIILESNQNHATIVSNGICPTLSASMGLGGYVPMIVVAVDLYNLELTGQISPPLTAAVGG